MYPFLGFVDTTGRYFDQPHLIDPKTIYSSTIHGHEASCFPKESVLRAYSRTIRKDCIRAFDFSRVKLASLDDATPNNSITLPRLRRMTAEEISQAVDYDKGLLIESKRSSNPADDRSIFTKSAKGLYLMVQPSAREGDLIAILDGGKVPVIFRPTTLASSPAATEKHYRFVCVAYVHGYEDRGRIHGRLRDSLTSRRTKPER